MDTLYIVVPCYNEEEALPESARVLRQKLRGLMAADKIAPDSRLLFVDDGSKDSTWYLIERLCRENDCIDGVKLSRNRGHQNAVMAGLVMAIDYAGATITIDADLQDDVDAIDEMVDKYNAGCPIVCGVRKSRSSDSFLKQFTARGYYALMNMCGAKIIYDHADFRLLSREAVKRLCRYGTDDLFIRGLVTRLELPIEKVSYDRMPRIAGESKYTVKKMLALALRGFECRKLSPAAEMKVGELYIEKVLHG